MALLWKTCRTLFWDFINGIQLCRLDYIPNPFRLAPPKWQLPRPEITGKGIILFTVRGCYSAAFSKNWCKDGFHLYGVWTKLQNDNAQLAVITINHVNLHWVWKALWGLVLVFICSLRITSQPPRLCAFFPKYLFIFRFEMQVSNDFWSINSNLPLPSFHLNSVVLFLLPSRKAYQRTDSSNRWRIASGRLKGPASHFANVCSPVDFACFTLGVFTSRYRKVGFT